MKSKLDNENFISALNFKVLTGYFDIFLRIFMKAYKIKNQFIKFAQVKADEKLLDFGCGTGTLLMMLATLYPNNELQGVDIDENVLKIAQKKFIKNDMCVYLKNLMELIYPMKT